MFEFCNLHPGLVLILTGIVVFFLPERLRGGAGIAGSLLAPCFQDFFFSDDASRRLGCLPAVCGWSFWR